MEAQPLSKPYWQRYPDVEKVRTVPNIVPMAKNTNKYQSNMFEKTQYRTIFYFE
jgi:hypothetical protein